MKLMKSLKRNQKKKKNCFFCPYKLINSGKKRQGTFRGKRRTGVRSESTSRSKKVRVGKELTCFKCKDPGHFKNECPKLKKERSKKNFRGKKKGLMATWDDSEYSEDEYEEERANMVLMACTEAPI